jgi:hypothetical protein
MDWRWQDLPPTTRIVYRAADTLSLFLQGFSLSKISQQIRCPPPENAGPLRSASMQSPVPSYTRSLHSLSAILTKAETHCEAREIDPNAILTARLFPDMLTFTRNVLIACDTAKGLAARLSQTDIPSFEDTETTFAELQARIAKTIEFMESVPETAFDGAEARTVVLKVGPTEMTLTGPQYFSGFATPNFYFHMTTAYAILRHNGVEIGKRDFLGAA